MTGKPFLVYLTFHLVSPLFCMQVPNMANPQSYRMDWGAQKKGEKFRRMLTQYGQVRSTTSVAQ
jgi:hypothetical protein